MRNTPAAPAESSTSASASSLPRTSTLRSRPWSRREERSCAGASSRRAFRTRTSPIRTATRSRSGLSEDAPHYRTDLAWIHHAGFSEFARVSSAGVLASLKAHDIREGLIVDIGCGSGVLARALTDAGYDVLGIDASPAMIELARVTAPAAQFE